MTARRATAVIAAIVVSLAGCAGDDTGSEELTRTVTPSADAPNEVGDAVDETLSEAQLRSALLTVTELPTGYTRAPDDVDGDDEDGQTVGQDAPCSERFQALDATDDLAVAKADVDFEAGLGVVLQQELSSFREEDELQERVGVVVDVLADCPSFTSEEDGGTTRFTVGELSFPELGDDTVALALAVTSQDLDVRLNIALVRLGRTLMTVSQGGLTADSAVLEQVTRTGLDKLVAVAGDEPTRR